MEPKPTEDKADHLSADETLCRYREMENPNVINADNDLLHPLSAGRIQIGCVDEVNGPGGAEVPEFVPTRHELIQIAKYWIFVDLDIHFSCWLLAGSGSTEAWTSMFAARRLGRITQLLGEDVVQKAVDEAWEEFGRKCDSPELWRIWREGTREDLQAVSSLWTGDRDPDQVIDEILLRLDVQKEPKLREESIREE